MINTFDNLPDGSVYHVSGVIRNSGKGFKVLDDKTHEPLNVIDVISGKRSVHITYPKANKTISFIITTDETYAREGIQLGASVARDKAKVYFYGLDKKLKTTSDLIVPNSNFWFIGTFRK